MNLRCGMCCEWLPSDQFGKTPRTSTGHQYYCKACFRQYRREHYLRNRDMPKYTTRKCLGCDKSLPEIADYWPCTRDGTLVETFRCLSCMGNGQREDRTRRREAARMTEYMRA